MKRFPLYRLALGTLGWHSPASRRGSCWLVPALALAALPAAALPADPAEVVASHSDGRTITSGDLHLANGVPEQERDYRGFVFPAGTDLEHACFRGARLEGADLRGTRCAHANFEGVELRYTLVAGADMTSAVLSGAHIWAEDGEHEPFRSAILVAANLHRKPAQAAADPRDGKHQDVPERDPGKPAPSVRLITGAAPAKARANYSVKELLDLAGLKYVDIDKHRKKGGNSWRILSGKHKSQDNFESMKQALKELLAGLPNPHGVTAEEIINAVPGRRVARKKRLPADAEAAATQEAGPEDPGTSCLSLEPHAASGPGLAPEGDDEMPLPWSVVGVRRSGQPVYFQDLRPGADLRWVTFLSDLEHSWRGAPFRRTLLEGAVLRGLDCRKADFTQCDLRRTDLEGTRLEGARFDLALVRADQEQMLRRQGADLERARIDQAALPSGDPAVSALDLLDKAGLTCGDIGRQAFPTWRPDSHRSRIRKELAGEIRFNPTNRARFENALKALLGPAGRNGVTAEQILAAIPDGKGRKHQAASTAAAPGRLPMDANEPVQPWNVVGIRPDGRLVFRQDLQPGADLRGVFFYGDLPRSWNGAAFRPSGPAGADRGRPDCQGADFSGSDLRLASLEGINVEGARFDGARVRVTQAETLLAQGADLRAACLDDLGPRSRLRRSGFFDLLPMAPRPSASAASSAPGGLEGKAGAGQERPEEGDSDPRLSFPELNAIVDDLLRVP